MIPQIAISVLILLAFAWAIGGTEIKTAKELKELKRLQDELHNSNTARK